MITKFTPQDIMEKRGCYEPEKVKKLSFIKQKLITLQDILKSSIPFKDKVWFFFCQTEISYDERAELWNASATIRKVIERYYGRPISHGPVGVCGWVCTLGYSVGYLEKRKVIKELTSFIDSKTKEMDDYRNPFEDDWLVFSPIEHTEVH